MNTSSKSSKDIDPRGPRFGAGITAVLLLITIVLGLVELPLPGDILARAGQGSFLQLAVITAIFAWGTFAGISRHPWGFLFKKLVRPWLSPPAFMEAPEPPTFAQLVGLLVTGVGIVLHLAGVPYGLVAAASAAFIAAFLNSVFGLCLGCELYALLVRARLVRST